MDQNPLIRRAYLPITLLSTIGTPVYTRRAFTSPAAVYLDHTVNEPLALHLAPVHIAILKIRALSCGGAPYLGSQDQRGAVQGESVGVPEEDTRSVLSQSRGSPSRISSHGGFAEPVLLSGSHR
jgi:hypothetical protein